MRLQWVGLLFVALGCTAGTDGEPVARTTQSLVSGYYLPWKAGVAFRCSRGETGNPAGGGHPSDQYNRYAYDWAMPRGTPIVASMPGTVYKAVRQCSSGQACFNGGFGCGTTAAGGNYVEIRHANGYVTSYIHLDSVAVSVGQVVTLGQVLGASGNTGCSFGAHLHTSLIQTGVTGGWATVQMGYADVVGSVPKCGTGTLFTSGNPGPDTDGDGVGVDAGVPDAPDPVTNDFPRAVPVPEVEPEPPPLEPAPALAHDPAHEADGDEYVRDDWTGGCATGGRPAPFGLAWLLMAAAIVRRRGATARVAHAGAAACRRSGETQRRGRDHRTSKRAPRRAR